MVNILVELSKYTILTLMILYTLHCFFMVRIRDRAEQRSSLASQLILTFFIDSISFMVLYLTSRDERILLFYGCMLAFFTVLCLLYRILYPKSSMALTNHMCMLMSIGFIMLCRLNMASAFRQLVIAAAFSALALLIPVVIRKGRFLKKLAWLYAGTGVLLLAAVLVLARTSYGAKLSLMGIQPSEAIKITFVFFAAAMLWNRPPFKAVVLTTGVAALHVVILVLSRDLGSALIFFVSYLVMLYAATREPLYLGAGLLGGAGASVAAYHLFGHVRERVSAWKDPLAVYENEGYQIVQSLFAIGTGGWFGMGLGQGSPESIPVVTMDLIFSAICEELGGIFAICLILICIFFFMLMLQLAMQIKSPFYKLTALGLGTEYAIQVFLTIGGATKLIPLTGVTLPLISYGGSSLASTILMLAIIQGLYIYREDEDEEIGRLRRESGTRRRLS